MTTFLPGQTLSAADLQELSATSNWTPTLTAEGGGLSLGSGGVQQLGWAHRNGLQVDLYFIIQFGSSGANPGSGAYRIDYPAGLEAATGWPDVMAGTCRIWDNDPGTEYPTFLLRGNSNILLMTAGGGFVAATVPMTWAAVDFMAGHVSYLMAP